MSQNSENAQIELALQQVENARSKPTRGKWLENLTVQTAPIIKDWDVAECYAWSEWPDREKHFHGSSKRDIGIDCVAVRNHDQGLIAIQCKSRRLESEALSQPLLKNEIDAFLGTTTDPVWQERWLLTNGEVELHSNAQQAIAMASRSNPIKMVNIHADLVSENAARQEAASAPSAASQSKNAMQEECIATSVRLLQEHRQSASGGLPVGQARGRIILPCGTGKTRISLRIVEELTPPGQTSIVLCPSIALVAQLRREYLQHGANPVNALAVCSDETAGYNSRPDQVADLSKDPTRDGSNVSADEIKGPVTTDPETIADWMRKAQQNQGLNVIFGTYQSAHRIAEALRKTDITAAIMVCDEAHRTAGIRKNAANNRNENLKNFTLCHDNIAFPATYRIYQTATPKVYDARPAPQEDGNWIVRSMDDETVFGVELYRRSYSDAVKNGWLADYRIVAVALNDPSAYGIANSLAAGKNAKGRNPTTVNHYIKGLAFALFMADATQPDNLDPELKAIIKSCIGFMNTTDKSKNMSEALTTQTVRNWVKQYLKENIPGRQPANYTLEHVQASSTSLQRDQAKAKLAQATAEQPHGVLNVGIFGEGTDSPSLSSVAFLEPRKSPIDVIQAVGRAMRTAPDKSMGYIFVPIIIPPGADPEQFLANSKPEDGWPELGQILLALRAHDERIEDQLAEMLTFYLPQEKETVATAVSIATKETGKIHHYYHVGPPGEAQQAAEKVIEQKVKPKDLGLIPLKEIPDPTTEAITLTTPKRLTLENTDRTDIHTLQTTAQLSDGSVETREDRPATEPPPKGSADTIGPIDVRKTTAKARKMINQGEGTKIPHSRKRSRRKQQEKAEQSGLQMLLLSGMDENSDLIRLNLLAKSGLQQDRIQRDFNLLEAAVKEAARHLREDQVQPHLDQHFGIDNLKETQGKNQADGCTIAALLMMNAAMLHQRIANGKWLTGVSDLATVKNAVNVVNMTMRQWRNIMRHDFLPVIEPAVHAIDAIEDTGRTDGLEKCLRHIAAEAERIAETYADMGSDHAGPLFNKVMGNQASDGAYFTRPVAAAIAARLTLDALEESNPVDWTDPEVWKQHKTVDLACGSGTLLVAMLTEMKRRAAAQGADEALLSQLQKLAVEETIVGLDINPVSLQLAASQLTAGNTDIRYKRMGLHLMPYGPNREDPEQVNMGTLELLGQQAIVPRQALLPDDSIGSQAVWNAPDDAELEDAVSAVQNPTIVTMNPPFSNQVKTGGKFNKDVQERMRSRTNLLAETLVKADARYGELDLRNTARPCFVSLADCIIPEDNGVLTVVHPTIVTTGTSGLTERKLLAERYHIHTILTAHAPGDVNLVEGSSSNESIIIATRKSRKTTAPTRFINLDRMPSNEQEVQELQEALQKCKQGAIPNGWGEISSWPAERIKKGDWSPAVIRAPEIAEAAYQYANHPDMKTIKMLAGRAHATGQQLSGSYERSVAGTKGSFPIQKSSGTEAQKYIQGEPDEYWIRKGSTGNADPIIQKAGNLLITGAQNPCSGRLTATAAQQKHIGFAWMPVSGITSEQAKATAVFLNSTAGRLQLMRNPGKTLAFPSYKAEVANNLRIPDVKDDRIRQILADCWEATKNTPVPQYREGECEVRRLWDEAVAQAMNWDADELARLRHLLHQEPHVRGLGYGQYAEAPIGEENETE